MVETIFPGDSREWTVSIFHSFGQLPDDAALTAYLRGSDGKLSDLEVSRQLGLIVVRLSPKVSKDLQPGSAFILLRVTSVSEDLQRTDCIGQIQVAPSIESENYDPRTEAQKCLEQAEAALSDYSTGRARVKSYTIGTRSLTFNSLQELVDLVNYWRKQVYLEQCQINGIDPRKYLVEFAP